MQSNILTSVRKASFENIVGKAKNAGYQIFSISLNDFWTEKDKFYHFKPFLWFLRVCSTCLENTAGKGEIACNEQFLLFPECFLPRWKTFSHSYQS